MRRGTVRAAVFAGLAATSLAAFSDDPDALLARAEGALRTTNYQGIVIYQDEDRLDALRVVHRFAADHERERITALNGEPREIFRDDDQISAILPKNLSYNSPRLVLKGFVHQLTPERLEALSNWYDIHAHGVGRVAGEDCLGIAITSKDRFRYSFQIWIDRISGVPLKLSLLNSDQAVIEQVMFTEVSFPAAIPDAAFTTTVNTSKFQLVTGTDSPTATPLEPVAGDSPQWSLANLPPGFRVVMHDARPGSASNAPMEHLLLTDGLSSISVFAEARGAHGQFTGLSHMGSVHAYGLECGDFHITVIGEAPSETIMSIGNGIRRTPDSLAGPPAGKA